MGKKRAASLHASALPSTKPELRAHFKKLRATIPADERVRIDQAIAQQVVDLPAFAEAEVLLAYLSFGAEVETRGIIRAAWDAGKLVALPRCVPGTRTMQWYRVDSLDNLVKSPLGVEEPAENPELEIDPAALDAVLVLVPGMAFDAQGYRLGYGGGFYDVLLASLDPARATTVGLCREAAFCSRFDCLDDHDLPVQLVVSA